MTYTTAQLRQKLYDKIYYGLSMAEADAYTNEIMRLFADYISQLELPKEWDLQECPNTEIVNSWCNRCFYCRNRDDYRFRDGYDRCLDDTATTLQKAAEQLRRTQ